MAKVNLFGKTIEEKTLLREKFVEPPFSILDSKSGSWKIRKQKWKDLGIKSELGRNSPSIHMGSENVKNNVDNYTSIFDPVLCELIYKWFCPEKGKILDPFCGGSVRGIVATYLGYKYVGIDLRQEQIDSNNEQANNIIKENKPIYLVGDSNVVLDNITDIFDFVFSCPPYFNLEKYSDLDADLSNMDYDKFLSIYGNIIKKCCNLLKPNSYACFVVGEIRDKNGYYVGLVPDTINLFKKCGMKYYNEGILSTPIASASMRAENNMKNKKLTKVHQNILVFKKVI